MARYLRNAVMHFKTITEHKILVMQHCFRVGLYRQGLMHDLSKYAWTEFRTGVRYYDGTQSPNTVERIETGISEAWLHHKGRNKHHYEYWIDYSVKKPGTLTGCRMPYRYVAEMFCDRVAASKVYKGKQYTDASAYEYFAPNKDKLLMHEKTRQETLFLLEMLRDEGEKKTFAWLKKEVRRRRREKDAY